MQNVDISVTGGCLFFNNFVRVCTISPARIKLATSKILHGGSLASGLPAQDANEPPCKIFDTVSFILGREIRNCTNMHTQNYKKKTVTNISTPCLSACLDNLQWSSQNHPHPHYYAIPVGCSEATLRCSDCIVAGLMLTRN